MKKLYLLLISFFLLNAAITPTLECRYYRGGYRHRSHGGDVAAGVLGGLATGLVAGAVASSAKDEGPTRGEIEAQRAQDKVAQLQREQQKAEMETLRMEIQQQKQQQQQMTQYRPHIRENDSFGFPFWMYWLALFTLLFIALAFLMWAKQKKQKQS